MLRRVFIVLLPVALLVSTVTGAALLLRGAAADMTRGAQRFLASLTDEQKTKAALAFDDPNRTKWHFIPLAERKGLQVKDMTDEQRQEALALLRACLSQVGYHKAEVIMGLESILAELEKTRQGGPIRDPHRYYWTLYGKPEPIGSWGLSIEGHHLSLNFTVKDGELQSFTPSFFGANPAVVHNHVDGASVQGTRILDKEEILAFELLASLNDDQRQVAVISAKPPKDVRSGGELEAPKSRPEGLPSKDLNAAQTKTLWALVDTYLNNMPPDVAAKRKAEIESGDKGQIYFAWAGADKPGIGHYYRVQGQTFLIEFVNVQPDSAGNPANHIHALWRDLRGDFGLTTK